MVAHCGSGAQSINFCLGRGRKVSLPLRGQFLFIYTCCWRTLTLNGELTVCALCECAPPLSLVRVRVSLNCVRHMRVYISKCVKCARASCVRCAKRDAQEACGSRELSTGRKNFYFSRYSRGDKSGKTLCKHTEKNEQWRIKRGENLWQGLSLLTINYSLFVLDPKNNK